MEAIWRLSRRKCCHHPCIAIPLSLSALFLQVRRVCKLSELAKRMARAETPRHLPVRNVQMRTSHGRRISRIVGRCIDALLQGAAVWRIYGFLRRVNRKVDLWDFILRNVLNSPRIQTENEINDTR